MNYKDDDDFERYFTGNVANLISNTIDELRPMIGQDSLKSLKVLLSEKCF